MVRLERVVQVEVVVAQQRVAGAEAWVVGVVQLVAVAALAVVGLVLGAEEQQQQGYHDRPHSNSRKVLDTKYHRIFQNFVSVVYSTFHLLCLFSFYFSCFISQLSSCCFYQQC